MIRDPETLALLQEGVARFVREVLIPHEEIVAQSDAIPASVVAQMRELGLFGLAIPEDFGGLGLTMEEEVLVAIELAHASPAFRSLVGTNNGIGAQGIVIDGTPQQKAHWLPRVASGEIIGAMEAACCKLFASEMCGRVADCAVQVHGGAGYMADSAIERFYRDVRLFRIYEGTSQIQQVVIARHLIRGAGA
jgi:alkylation response protein AidB-like acyl-CoA dehydrogenase